MIFFCTVLTTFDSIADCPLPILHGVSAFGTGLRFYQVHHDKPSHILSHPNCAVGRVPAEYWDCDLLEKEGEEKFRTMVKEIKDACSNL